MDPRCRIYNDKFPQESSQHCILYRVLFMYQSINVLNVEFASRIEISSRLSFDLSVGPTTRATCSHKSASMQEVNHRFPLLMSLLTSARNNANVFSFFFFFPFFPPHFLTLHCAELALESKDVPRRRSIGRGVFLFETRLFPNRAA